MNRPYIASGSSESLDANPSPRKVIAKRVTAEVEGDFVVFLIGMRINKPLKVHKWYPVARAMTRMLKELEARPEAGLLGWQNFGFVVVQYWRSFDHLEAYSRSPESSHLPAWSAFNRRMSNSRGDVGIWHETYLVSAGRYEAIYSGMPPFGLGKIGRLVDAEGTREGARGRVGAI